MGYIFRWVGSGVGSGWGGGTNSYHGEVLKGWVVNG